MERGKIILTSRGLTTSVGYRLISKELKKDNKLSEKTIYLFHEPHFSIGPMLIETCLKIGFQKENIYLAGPDISAGVIEKSDYLYTTEGNTFEVLDCMQNSNVIEPMREAFRRGASYIGASAGAMIAGKDISFAYEFDRNFVGLIDVEGLQLFDGTVIPHYAPKHLKRFLENEEPEMIARYPNIYSVDEDEILVL